MHLPFQTTFAVPLHCESCVEQVSTSLYKVSGVDRVDVRAGDQLVMIEGTAAPSAVVAAIQATGRDAILRGSGTSDGAAVCILETHSARVASPVRGLARMVQVSPRMTLFDLTVRGVSPGRYWATVRETGDISRGATSTGGIWGALKALSGRSQTTAASEGARGVVGALAVGPSGTGSVFLDRPIPVWEMIGRGFVVSKQPDGDFSRDDPDVLVGVVARSAGVWDNIKTVCSCSGKTMWYERREKVNRGML